MIKIIICYVKFLRNTNNREIWKEKKYVEAVLQK